MACKLDDLTLSVLLNIYDTIHCTIIFLFVNMAC